MSLPLQRPWMSSRFGMGVLDGYFLFNLRWAHARCVPPLQAARRHPGLRPGWFALLSLINDNPGITPLALSRASGRDKSTLTPLLRDLLREKLIQREETPADRRSYTLRLTAKGGEALEHLAVCAAAHDREIAAIAGDQKPALLALLRRIATELG